MINSTSAFRALWSLCGRGKTTSRETCCAFPTEHRTTTLTKTWPVIKTTWTWVNKASLSNAEVKRYQNTILSTSSHQSSMLMVPITGNMWLPSSVLRLRYVQAELLLCYKPWNSSDCNPQQEEAERQKECDPFIKTCFCFIEKLASVSVHKQMMWKCISVVTVVNVNKQTYSCLN